MAYKIRNTKTGQYSHGNISVWQKKMYIKWSAKGKEWTNEKNLRAHLLKCATLDGIPTDWEVIEIKHVATKPIEEWIDNEMLMKLLKINHNKK